MPRTIPRSGRRARAPASPARRRSCSWWCSWRATWTWWPTSSPSTTPQWRSSLSAPRPPLSTSCMSSSRPPTTATTTRSGALLLAVLRIRDVYPVSRIRVFSSLVPDPNFFYPGSKFFHPGFRIFIKDFKYINPRKWFLSSRKNDPGCASRIRIRDPEILPTPDPEFRAQ